MRTDGRLMSEDLQARWQELIIDHSQFPRCHGRLEQPSHQGQGENPFCGDRVTLQLAVSEDTIRDIRFEATGCAISIASASMLCEQLRKRSTDEARQRFQSVHSMLTEAAERNDMDELGDLEALQAVRRYPSRVKCATLVWHVLNHALQGQQGTVSTE
jgi:nitrogen fixation NifU-like protein